MTNCRRFVAAQPGALIGFYDPRIAIPKDFPNPVVVPAIQIDPAPDTLLADQVQANFGNRKNAVYSFTPPGNRTALKENENTVSAANRPGDAIRRPAQLIG